MYRSVLALIFLAAGFLLSCSPDSSPGRRNPAVLWTDRPEFALYAEYFNTSQEQFKIETRYFEHPAQKLREFSPNQKESYPDIVAGNWLKSASTRVFFRPLDEYFRNNSQLRASFYERLLAMGNIDGKQYLLPVSFNAPMVITTRDKGGKLSNPFTIGFDEMKLLGRNYNTETNGMYTKMGFSPTWDDNFLYITTTLFNVSFREAEPLAWDPQALEKAMNFSWEWNNEANTSIHAVDEFIFKYLYEPPSKLVLSGRILFTCMNSDAFFTLSEDQRNNLDFRWLAERNIIPLADNSVYIGLVKKGRAEKAANAFLHWFFLTDTQRYLLERSRQNRMSETSFGIGGGFSALATVTEQIFPQFYPDLLGHMPPQDFLSPSNVLPGNWMIIKERVVLPYIHDRARQPDNNEVYPLERRLADWKRVNR